MLTKPNVNVPRYSYGKCSRLYINKKEMSRPRCNQKSIHRLSQIISNIDIEIKRLLFDEFWNDRY